MLQSFYIISNDHPTKMYHVTQAFTFLFYEDVEENKEGNICTNRHASQDTFFARNGEEKKAATFSNVSNEYRYLDSNESAEGCPSKRFAATLERKVSFFLLLSPSSFTSSLCQHL